MLRYLSFIGAFLLFGWTVARSEEPTAVEISKPVAFMNGGDFQRAIVAFNAIANEHRTVKVYLHRALCWSNLGKDVEAHTEIASAQSLPPKADVWHSDFVDIERVWGDIERSMLERPIVTARYLGNSRRAIELADMAVREAPSDAEIIFLRALAHLDEEQYSLALMDADEAVRHDPLNADRYKFRSLLLIWEHPKQIDKVRGLDAALADASEAVRLRPAADTYLHRARIHTFKKDFGHAADDFSKVARHSSVARHYGSI
jgi:tetratricopeptide (TPR) repeat protein